MPHAARLPPSACVAVACGALLGVGCRHAELAPTVSITIGRTLSRETSSGVVGSTGVTYATVVAGLAQRPRGPVTELHRPTPRRQPQVPPCLDATLCGAIVELETHALRRALRAEAGR